MLSPASAVSERERREDALYAQTRGPFAFAFASRRLPASGAGGPPVAASGSCDARSVIAAATADRASRNVLIRTGVSLPALTLKLLPGQTLARGHRATIKHVRQRSTIYLGGLAGNSAHGRHSAKAGTFPVGWWPRSRGLHSPCPQSPIR
jgi:hypothetical protein